MPKMGKSKSNNAEQESHREIADLSERARDRRSKMIGDQVVTILRDMLTSWRSPKPVK